jgi:deoxycytidylate deaminase
MSDISDSDRRWFHLAMKTAELSLCQFKHGAVITFKRKPISVGCNIPKMSGSIRRLTRNAPFDSRAELRRNRSDQIHAETVAILKARSNLDGATLYSARYRPRGFAGDSCPCESCSQHILLSGISCVVYSQNGELRKVKL